MDRGGITCNDLEGEGGDCSAAPESCAWLGSAFLGPRASGLSGCTCAGAQLKQVWVFPPSYPGPGHTAPGKIPQILSDCPGDNLSSGGDQCRP